MGRFVKNGIQPLWRELRRLTLHRWIQLGAGLWFWLAAILLVGGDGTFATATFAQEFPLWLLLGGVLSGAVAVLALDRLLDTVLEGWLMLSGGVALTLLLALKNGTSGAEYLYYAICLALALLIGYAVSRGTLPRPPIHTDRRLTPVVLGVLFVLMAGMISLYGAVRYLNYYAPNYDFGIFCQMFHYMKETGLPLTTCERDGLLSHFAVHISPVYYLLLPLYCLFPSPVTLAVSQGVVLASGLLPLYLIAKKRRLDRVSTWGLLLVYALYPALSCGCLYDLHENMFLTPLLLWLFCAGEYERGGLTFLAAVGVLAVKEDAAVYVVLWALYLMLSRRSLKPVWIAGVGLAYFGVALGLLAAFGEGGMVNRYSALSGGDGLIGVVFTLVRNPGLFLKTLLAPQNSVSRLWYAAQLALPLGALLWNRRHWSRAVLLLPILLNLLSNWAYQMDLGFQYSFGISAFFLYTAVLNAADCPPKRRRALVGYAAAATAVLYIMLFWPRVHSTVSGWNSSAERREAFSAALEQIPDDASVTCSTYLLPHLAQRETVYEDYYHTDTDTDYLVRDLKSYGESIELREQYAAAGYTVVYEDPGYVLIMKRGK